MQPHDWTMDYFKDTMVLPEELSKCADNTDNRALFGRDFVAAFADATLLKPRLYGSNHISFSGAGSTEQLLPASTACRCPRGLIIGDREASVDGGEDNDVIDCSDELGKVEDIFAMDGSSVKLNPDVDSVGDSSAADELDGNEVPAELLLKSLTPDEVELSLTLRPESKGLSRSVSMITSFESPTTVATAEFSFPVGSF